MYYYAYDKYMEWYNWYYGIKPTQPEETKVEETKNEVEACPHTFPSLNFTTNIAELETQQETPVVETEPNADEIFWTYKKKNRCRKV